MPALLMRTSTWPDSWVMRRTAAAMDASDVTSQLIGTMAFGGEGLGAEGEEVRVVTASSRTERRRPRR